MFQRHNSRFVGRDYNGRSNEFGGLAGPFNAINASGRNRQALDNLLLFDGTTVGNWRAGAGITGTLAASAWANQMGIAGPLLQATGANQPIVLPFAGEKYAYLPGVAGNTFTSPNKSVTGNQTITFSVALDDYTPAADVTLIDKTSGNNGFALKWLTTGKVRIVIGDGASLTNVDVVAASGFTDASKHTVSIAWVDGVGATFSYDGVVSGAQVAAVKTLANAAVAITLGSTTSKGKPYRVQVGAVYDWNAADWPETSTNGATQASSTTSEVWTLNNTGGVLAQIVASAQLVFNGLAHFMAAAFVLVQPTSYYVVASKVTQQAGQSNLFDAFVAANSYGYFNPASMTFLNYANGSAIADGVAVAGTIDIFSGVFNGAASFAAIGTSETAGAGGAGNMDGMTIGSAGGGATNFGNIKVKEIILRNAADSAGTRAKIRTLLKAIHGTP